jgi:hypothetical protein
MSSFPVSAVEGGETWGSSMSIATLSQAQVRSDEGPRSDALVQSTYVAQTELADGRQALLVDPGSWGNVSGKPWMRRSASLAVRSGRTPSQTRRERPLRVQGVGHGAQSCTHDVNLPVALPRTDGTIVEGIFTSPTINDDKSDLPALLGLKTLIDRRAILDCTTLQLHFLGPGDLVLNLPPGSESFQLVQAPSGHLMLPCCDYSTAAARTSDSAELALISNSGGSSSSTTNQARTGEVGNCD